MDVLVVLRAAFSGRYEVEAEVGVGGMALVYAARDLRHDRRVAIKVLKPDIARTLGVDRFLREIRIEAQLEHPHILPLFESGVADGLLYYVMRLVEGESLRDRLRREVQLSIPETLRIAGEVAAALDYAHSRGVIHRDIKPENILLAGEHAYVADFGIARAAGEAGGSWQAESETSVWRTDTGIAIGTLGYMSPEQATGSRHLTGRSDQYSLACVVYEMLAGETPYTATSLQAFVGKVLGQPVPSIRVMRETVTSVGDRAIRRALAKTPADRFQSCRGFMAAVERQPTVGDTLTGLARTRAARITLAGGLAVTAAALLLGKIGFADGAFEPDTTRYVIFPLESDAAREAQLDATRWIHDAFRRWTGLTVISPLELGEVLGEAEKIRTPSRAAEIARRLGAGRYVRLAVSPLGDSMSVYGALYHVRPRGPPLRLSDHRVRVPRDLRDADSLFAVLGDYLLLRGELEDHTSDQPQTHSLPAHQAFITGRNALQTWDLVAADSAFATALRFDRAYALAHLWLALVRWWGGAEAGTWAISVEQAALGWQSLSADGRALVDALLAQASGDLTRACPLWNRTTEARPTGFAGWYGWSLCQVRDDAVVRDAASPSGWRFRTSYYSALTAFRRAVQLHPPILDSFRDRSYVSLRTFFMTGGNERRGGRALGRDTMTFEANPAWKDDSLVLIPYPHDALRLSPAPPTFGEAVSNLRKMFRDVALSWVASAPHSAHAVEAVGISLALLGDPAALDTLRRARVLASNAREQFRLASGEVWVQLAFSIPWNEDAIRNARLLADSLLENQPPGRDPSIVAGLGALTGRAHLAAAASRERTAATGMGAPPPLWEAAPPLLVYSSLGGPKDSIVVLERRVQTLIDETLLPARRPSARLQWLARPATLAFHTYPFSNLQSLAGQGDHLLDVQAAWLAGDSAVVLRGLKAIRESRRGLLPENLTFDGLQPEAELLVSVGAFRQAAEWIDPTLRALPRIAPHVLTSPERVAALVRSMALRATLADRLHDDKQARQWARVVVALWGDGDDWMQPQLSELRRLAR